MISMCKVLIKVLLLTTFSFPIFAQSDVPGVQNSGDEFPKPDPANFTTSSPTKELVNAFLTANWGYDENRVWEPSGTLAIHLIELLTSLKAFVFLALLTPRKR